MSVSAWLAPADPAEVGLDASRLDALTRAFRHEIDRGRLPGAVLMAVRHGRLAYHEVLGRLDPARPEPMRADALFRVYSMTKPVVSVAAMRLVEQGLVALDDPVADHLPAFAATPLGIPDGDEGLRLQAPPREMTVLDLLRHTAGFTYEFLPPTPVRRLYIESQMYRLDWSSQDFVRALARLPLMHPPGERWEYSRATDVLGVLIETLTGRRLGEHLAEHIFRPLHMPDTGFSVPAAGHGRIAEPFRHDPDGSGKVFVLDVREPPGFDMGGGGLVSTADDYARFLQMLLNGGEFDGQRVLRPETVRLMMRDHLADLPVDSDVLPLGHGFGLGFAVRKPGGRSFLSGPPGLCYWGGLAGTSFFIDPSHQMFAVMMLQAPAQRDEYRTLFRNSLCEAVVD